MSKSEAIKKYIKKPFYGEKEMLKIDLEKMGFFCKKINFVAFKN